MRLNLGCGDLYQHGWLNVDLPSCPSRVDLALDLRGPLPWPPNSVTHVYAGHVLEHLTVDEATDLLRRLLPSMSPSGQIMVVGPDCERGAAMHASGELSTDLWRLFPTGAGRWPGDEHHWDCEPATLQRILKEAGWVDVREVLVAGVPEPWPVAARDEWQCAVSARRGG